MPFHPRPTLSSGTNSNNQLAKFLTTVYSNYLKDQGISVGGGHGHINPKGISVQGQTGFPSQTRHDVLMQYLLNRKAP